MKIVQSFWSGNQKDFNNSYGWYSKKHHWLSWILSCNQLIKYHNDVELYTDNFGYDILIKKLKLPYTKVHVVLDELNNYNKNLWAVGKIKTFQIQTQPFLHVDGDVFVWESLTDKFKESNLITQNLEITTNYYRTRWERIHPQLNYIPEEIIEYHNGKSNLACNMGIIGGTNLNFFKKYTKKSFEFVDRNKIIWNDEDSLNFNIFFEQVLFYEMANKKKEHIDFQFSEISLDNDYKGFGDFEKTPQKTYLHLLGDYKRNPNICKTMETYIMKYYPEEYSNLSFLINTNDKKNLEIDYLNKHKVRELISAFEKELKNNDFISDDFLLKRDLYNQNHTLVLNKWIEEKIDFSIVKLNGNERKGVKQEDNYVDFIEISEINSVSNFYYLDNIDDIILGLINKPIKYNCFIKEMKNQFDLEDENSYFDLLLLINQRLRFFVELKIISVYN